MHENTHAARMSLDGQWQIEIGDQRGIITIPGVWEVQGFPKDSTHARLERQIDVPAGWRGTKVMLAVSAASYDVTFEVNGQAVGRHIGMWSPFEFDISAHLHYGERNIIIAHVIKPSNTSEGTYPYREVLVGFVPYISSTFGGIWQSIALVSHRKSAWTGIKIQPSLMQKTVRIEAQLSPANSEALVTINLYDAEGSLLIAEHTTGSTVDITLPVDDVQPWQPDNPYLYTIELEAEGTFVSRTFGFRRLEADGRDLRLNGHHCFLRGILSWGWNPEALAPVFSEPFIREEFQRVRDLGFNLYKLCLYVPPEILFRIADEEGMLLWLELPMWWQLNNPHLREQLPKEYAEIIARVHHHPSIVLVSLGCEIEDYMVTEGIVHQLEHIVREAMTGILLCENSGSGEAYDGLTMEIADFYDYHFYADAHYFQPMINHFRRDWRTSRPWIFGEFAAQDDYRNPHALVDAHGQRLWWRDLLGTDGGIERWAYCDQEERLADLKLPFNHEQLQALSRKQSYALRKLILETTRKNVGMGGYVITGLRDTPITTSGIWDDHLHSKYSVEAMRQINNADVLLLEQGRRRVWIEGDRPLPQDTVNHWSGSQADFYILFSGLHAPATSLVWQLSNASGEVVVSGTEDVVIPPLDANPHQIAHINWTFPTVDSACHYDLSVTWADISNRWRLWLYPQNDHVLDTATIYDPAGTLTDLHHLPQANLAQPTGVIIASALTESLEVALQAGAKVVLMQAGHGAIPAKRIAFWQESLNLILEHPLWDNMAHEGVATEQFYHIATDFGFDPTESTYVPVLRCLHTRHFTATDLVIDMKIGGGHLIGTTLRLFGGQGDQAQGVKHNVLGTYLLSKMINLLRSP